MFCIGETVFDVKGVVALRDYTGVTCAFFMEKTADIHVGEIIKTILDARGQSYSWLARQINTDVSNVPKILKRDNLNTDLLLRISLAMKVDSSPIILNNIKTRVNKWFGHKSQIWNLNPLLVIV